MLRYFYATPTCSLAAMVALEATGTAYEPVLVNLASDRGALRSVSSMGKVPVLQADSLVITDTVAITYWLAQQFPQANLLPSAPDLMALALARLTWFGSVLHIARRQYTRPMMFCEGADAQAAVKTAAAPRYWAELVRVDEWIGSGQLSAIGVEAYALLFYHWGLIDGLPMGELTHYTALAKLLSARDDVGRALTRHASPLLDLATTMSANRMSATDSLER